MIKNSEALGLSRNEYIIGYKEKNKTIFPTNGSYCKRIY